MSQQALITEENQQRGRRLAFSLLKRWGCRLPNEDVESITALAMCKAAARFQEEKGSKFETYMYFYVRAGLIEAVASIVSAKRAVCALLQCELEDSSDLQGNALAHSAQMAKTEIFTLRTTASSPELAMLYCEQETLLREGLSQLPESEQFLLRATFFERKSPSDLAKSLGISKATLKKRLQSSLDKLKDILCREGS